MKVLTGTLLSSFVVAVLAGCNSPAPTQADANKDVQDKIQVVDLDVNGRKIPCLIWQDGSHANGISCDWSAK